MKITNAEKVILVISAVAFIVVGIPFAGSGYIAGWASLIFGFVNCLICLFSKRR